MYEVIMCVFLFWYLHWNTEKLKNPIPLQGNLNKVQVFSKFCDVQLISQILDFVDGKYHGTGVFLVPVLSLAMSFFFTAKSDWLIPHAIRISTSLCTVEEAINTLIHIDTDTISFEPSAECITQKAYQGEFRWKVGQPSPIQGILVSCRIFEISSVSHLY